MSPLPQGGLPLDSSAGGGRFPGFDSAAQAPHWDDVTTGVVLSRLGLPPDIRFFTPAEEAAARSLFDQLLDQRTDPRIPVANMVDARLAEEQTDGWHYDGMPSDGDSWRQSLAGLDADARDAGGCLFWQLSWDDQHEVLDRIHQLGAVPWRGLENAERVWSLWTRYACTAFYSHPWAWDEIGFAGPAYPRGYKNLGLNAREPFEVPDARPAQDPLRTTGGRQSGGGR